MANSHHWRSFRQAFHQWIRRKNPKRCGQTTLEFVSIETQNLHSIRSERQSLHWKCINDVRQISLEHWWEEWSMLAPSCIADGTPVRVLNLRKIKWCHRQQFVSKKWEDQLCYMFFNPKFTSFFRSSFLRKQSLQKCPTCWGNKHNMMGCLSLISFPGRFSAGKNFRPITG